MKKSITVISAVLLFAMVGAATDIPKYEIYLGYQYVRANQFNQNNGLGQSVGGYDMSGGVGQFIYSFNHWVSFVGEGGGVTKPRIGIPGFDIGVSNTTAFVYGGPRFYYRRHNHGFLGFTPFGQVLLGAAFRHLSTNVTALTSIDTPNVPIATPFGPVPRAPCRRKRSIDYYTKCLFHEGRRRSGLQIQQTLGFQAAGSQLRADPVPQPLQRG